MVIEVQNVFYENKDKISNQKKFCYEKRERILQKQNNRHINYKELLISYVESENKLKALEEKLKNYDSEKH